MCRLRANFPLPYCFSVFCFGSCIFFCLPSADFRRRKDWKVEFPDVSSFPRHSPYRGYGGWSFGNRIHHLMRSFHPSDTNIAEGSIFLPPWRKNFRKFLGPILKTPPKGLWKNDLRFFTAPFVYINFHGNWPNDSLLPASTSFRP